MIEGLGWLLTLGLPSAELGIDIPAILRRSRGILLNRLGANEMQELDMGGPLCFALLLGGAHLLASLP